MPKPLTWTFRARFRRDAFGWKGSRLAIERIDEALAEIRAVARHDTAGAAEGAVLFLEKLSPALSQVDSSSGAIGSAAHRAVLALAPLIRDAPVARAIRDKWLDRLFEAIQDDDPPYIESLGDLWGDLCSDRETASEWADRLLPTVQSVRRERARGTWAFFTGTSPCYSALFKADRHDELLELLAGERHPIWTYLVWGGRVLAARGQVDEAIAYVSERAGTTTGPAAIAYFAEDLLLGAGRRAEAFDRYALLANQAHSHLATFRALAKKYPELAPDRLLAHLVASTPDAPGKWFATAKTLRLFDEAVRLAWASPCDPKTLTRAARDHAAGRPEFAMQCALAALHWISAGYGYELSGIDVLDARRLTLEAAEAVQRTAWARAAIDELLAAELPGSTWMRQVLGMEPRSAAARRPR